MTSCYVSLIRVFLPRILRIGVKRHHRMCKELLRVVILVLRPPWRLFFAKESSYLVMIEKCISGGLWLLRTEIQADKYFAMMLDLT